MTAPDMFAIGSPKWPGLSKLTEESGEAQQVIGKLMGTGGETAHWDGTNLYHRLIDEVGDTLAACRFVGEKNGCSSAIEKRAMQKLALFNQWHAEGGEPLAGITDDSVDVRIAKLTEERDAARTQKDTLTRQLVALQEEQRVRNARANQFESLLRIMRTRRYAASSSTSFDWRVLPQYWNELDALLPESKPHTCINTQATSDGSVPPPCPACQEQPEHTALAPALGVLVVHKVFGRSTVVSMPENGDKTWMRLRLIETGDVYLAYTADVSLPVKEKR